MELYLASVDGDLDALRRLVAGSSPATWDAHAINGAAMGGNVKCLQFALECGAPFDPAYAAMLAAQKGHLDALVFVHAKAGAPMAWRPSTLYWAALNNHVGCARYLLEHMRPLSRRQVADALAAAKMGACRDCMFLLHDALHA